MQCKVKGGATEQKQGGEGAAELLPLESHATAWLPDIAYSALKYNW